MANRDINQGSSAGNRGNVNQRENVGGQNVGRQGGQMGGQGGQMGGQGGQMGGQGGQMGGQRQGWDQFRGRLREKWGNLRDEDLNRLGKNRNELVGHISQQGGGNRQEIERDVDRFSKETGYRFE